MSAKGWELRAAVSLTRLLRERNKCKEARDLFAPVYMCFTEGLDTPDLKHAKTPLDELI
jgi:predicted ATPase